MKPITLGNQHTSFTNHFPLDAHYDHIYSTTVDRSISGTDTRIILPLLSSKHIPTLAIFPFSKSLHPKWQTFALAKQVGRARGHGTRIATITSLFFFFYYVNTLFYLIHIATTLSYTQIDATQVAHYQRKANIRF